MNAEFLRAVRLPDLKSFLLDLGWRTTPHPNRRITYLESVVGGMPIVLPAAGQQRDEHLILLAVEEAAEVLNLPPEAVAAKIANWTQDTVRVRIFDTVADVASLSLSSATEAIAGLRRFFSHTATNHVNPQPYFPKSTNVGQEFASSCRFGHTFEGSFGLRIESPFHFEPPLPMDNNPPDAPFERQVIERMAAGFEGIRQAANDDNWGSLLDSYIYGMNANGLHALAHTYEAIGGLRMEFDFVWGGRLESEFVGQWKPFVFEGRAYDVTRRAASEMEKVKEETERLIEGHVITLKSDQPPEEDQTAFEHVITVFWSKEQKLRVKIRIPLSWADYRLACDAHKDGRKIRVFGVPKKTGKYWTLGSIRGFTVI